jgi:AcrR family transcriptional regulator
VPASYHHGNLRAALIDTAVELARAEGPSGVVLREVARRAGVSHNAAYRHFSDRAQLLAEVAAVGMDALEQSMRARIDALDRTDPVAFARASLSETGRAYVDFALSEPGLFRVAFSSDLPDPGAGEPGAGEPGAGETGAAGKVDVGPYGLLNQALDRLVEVGVLPASRREGADVACWAAVHGFAVLHLDDGPMGDSPPTERDAALDRMLTVVETGLTVPTGSEP